MARDSAKAGIVAFLRTIRPHIPMDDQMVLSALGDGTLRSNPNVGDYLAFRGSLGEFEVARATNRVVGYIAPPSVDIDEGFRVAESFARKAYPRLSERPFELIRKEATGTELIFVWKEQRRDKELSIFHNFVEVHVDGSGAVTQVDASDRDHVRIRPVAVTREKAIEIARGKGWAGEPSEVHLSEVPEADGPGARTLWTLIYEGGAEGGLSWANALYIDADTGEVVEG